MNPLLAATVGTLLLSVSGSPYAQSAETSNNANTTNASKVTPDVYCNDDGCKKVSPWHFGLGAGAGKRSNPLINSDDININWFVDLAYFGEHFFFDNGDLGFTFKQTDRYTLNGIVSYGNEKAFFSHFKDESFSFSDLKGSFEDVVQDVASPGIGGFGTLDTGSATPSNDTQETTADVSTEATPTVASASQLDIEEPPDRDYSVEGGLELIYETAVSEIQSQLLTDISSTHDGAEWWFSYGYPFQSGNFKISPAVGFSWKSADLVDYYYGVRPEETNNARAVYKAGSTANLFLKLSMAYRLLESWQVVSVLEYEKLGVDIKNSPLIDDDSVTTAFLGLFYRFK